MVKLFIRWDKIFDVFLINCLLFWKFGKVYKGLVRFDYLVVIVLFFILVKL